MMGEANQDSADRVRALLLDESVNRSIAALISRAGGIEIHEVERILAVVYAELMQHIIVAVGIEGAGRIAGDHAAAMSNIARLISLSPAMAGKPEAMREKAQLEWLAFSKPRGRA